MESRSDRQEQICHVDYKFRMNRCHCDFEVKERKHKERRKSYKRNVAGTTIHFDFRKNNADRNSEIKN